MITKHESDHSFIKDGEIHYAYRYEFPDGDFFKLGFSLACENEEKRKKLNLIETKMKLYVQLVMAEFSSNEGD